MAAASRDRGERGGAAAAPRGGAGAGGGGSVTESAARAAAREAAARRFPALAGARPACARSGGGWVFTFDHHVPDGPGGRPLHQVVRVSVDESGRVVKVVAAR